MIKAHFISPTPPARSTEQQAARSKTATRTLASEETTEQLFPLLEQHLRWSSLSLAVGVKYSEPSTIKKSARPSFLSTPDSHHVASVSSGKISYSCLSWQSFCSVSQFQRAERSAGTSDPSSSLTVGNQHAFPPFTDKPVDSPRDATLDHDQGQPTAIGPRTRPQTRRAAKKLSAHDWHSSDSCLHNPSRNDDSDGPESDPCPIFLLPPREMYGARDARLALRRDLRSGPHPTPLPLAAIFL